MTRARFVWTFPALIILSVANPAGMVPEMNGLSLPFVAGEAAMASGSRDGRAEPTPAQEKKVIPHPTGDANKGQVLYDASCVVCHGAGATGGIGPRLAGNPILSNDKLFWDRVLTGRHMMPPLGDALTPQQIADILAWLKTLR